MPAKFHKLSYNSTFTELDFKVVDILDETPINFDFKSAKFFSIYASNGACAMKCLKGIVPGEYLITGRMFQGRLVVSGKFMLLHFPKATKKIFFWFFGLWHETLCKTFLLSMISELWFFSKSYFRIKPWQLNDSFFFCEHTISKLHFKGSCWEIFQMHAFSRRTTNIRS